MYNSADDSQIPIPENVSDTKSLATFDGWEQVPRDYKTRSGWQAAFRRVEKGQEPSAMVEVRRTRRFDSIDADYEVVSEYKLYHVSQTRPVRKTALAMARHEFFRDFVQRADRKRYIPWTKGDWVEEDGTRYWDDTIDHWGWRTYNRWLSKQDIIDHLLGKEIHGVFGAESSQYLLIDLDLHGSPLTLFLRRFAVLLDALHGRHACNVQVSDDCAGGVHIVLFFGTSSPLVTRRKWLLGSLEKLHAQHPECKLLRPDGSLKLEVYPSVSNPHRL